MTGFYFLLYVCVWCSSACSLLLALLDGRIILDDMISMSSITMISAAKKKEEKEAQEAAFCHRCFRFLSTSFCWCCNKAAPRVG